MQHVIRPRWGMGALRLGMTRPEVLRVLGEPDHIEEDDEAGAMRVGWHYDRFELSLYFDEDCDDRVTLIITESASAQLGSAFPIGMRAEEAVRALRELGELVRDDEVSNEGLDFYSLAEASVGLLFADGVCESVDIAAYKDEDGETVWPEADAPA